MSIGGNGSHWEGCETAHHDCALERLREARAEAERLREGKAWVEEQMRDVERWRDRYLAAIVRALRDIETDLIKTPARAYVLEYLRAALRGEEE